MLIRDVADGVVECLAPAKVNLFLEILGKRSDGYHDVETLMVTVDLYDTLRLSDDPTGHITLRCDAPGLPTGPENLVVRAATRLRSEAGVSNGVAIDLWKSIPVEAGLAGGSTDAASTLVGLDRLWNLQTSPDRLNALAGEIGSDVAFFRHAPAAVCRGRGERVEAVSMPQAFHVVLICPRVGNSTAEVYRNSVVPDRPRSIEPVLEALVSSDIAALGRGLFNRLQETAERLRPDLRQLRDALEALGPALDGHLMSGSGSAYFGLARNREAADDAARRLDSLGLGQVRVVTSGLPVFRSTA